MPPAAAAGRSSPLTDKQILTLLGLSGQWIAKHSSWLASGQIASGSGLSASSMASRNLRSGSHEAISYTVRLYGGSVRLYGLMRSPGPGMAPRTID